MRFAAARAILAVVDEKEIQARVEEILSKRDRAEKLTENEETILAYAYYAAREQRMTFVVPSEADRTAAE